jgi:hypothetical protein
LNTERKQHWHTILKISGEMHELAQDMQWENLARLESKRHQLIKSFFSQPVAIEDADLIRAGIHNILDLDQQIISLGKKHRGEIGGKLVDFQAHKRAAYAYKNHSR